ncbi:hypothetical protein GCM10009545_23230 [Saccharopolyspora thermophila]
MSDTTRLVDFRNEYFSVTYKESITWSAEIRPGTMLKAEVDAMATEYAANRHYWLPIPGAGDIGGTRHAFRGLRWEGQSSGSTVCGQEVAMAKPSEMDWCLFPTCQLCNGILVAEQRPDDRREGA